MFRLMLGKTLELAKLMMIANLSKNAAFAVLVDAVDGAREDISVYMEQKCIPSFRVLMNNSFLIPFILIFIILNPFPENFLFY